MTVCIVHYNKIDRLKNTISYLIKGYQDQIFIRILNNGHTNSEIDSFLREFEKESYGEVIWNDINVGCSAGRKRLMENIDTEYVMTLDDDMYVCNKWLSKIINIFEQNEDIGVVGIPYRNPNKTVKIGGAFIDIRSKTIYKTYIDWENDDSQESWIEVEDVPAGAMAFRSELTDEFEWDDRYFIGFDDLDKSIQLMNTDWKQVISTNLEFKHDPKKKKSYTEIRKNYSEIRQSYKKFCDKWEYRLPLKDHILYQYIFLLPNNLLNMISSVRN